MGLGGENCLLSYNSQFWGGDMPQTICRAHGHGGILLLSTIASTGAKKLEDGTFSQRICANDGTEKVNLLSKETCRVTFW